tara:strand:- start:261 stop:425 length:165 start_codon:yes stop_codon:yes gene_type:complete
MMMFERSKIFNDNLKFTENNGLQDEFIDTLFRRLNVTEEQLQQACNEALLEWDL